MRVFVLYYKTCYLATLYFPDSIPDEVINQLIRIWSHFFNSYISY